MSHGAKAGAFQPGEAASDLKATRAPLGGSASNSLCNVVPAASASSVGGRRRLNFAMVNGSSTLPAFPGAGSPPMPVTPSCGPQLQLSTSSAGPSGDVLVGP